MSDLPTDGRQRVVIENVTPRIDGGRFPIKRVIGESLTVQADAFGDGHDEIRVVLRWAGPVTAATPEPGWNEIEMEPLGNDLWQAAFPLEALGRYRYTIVGWVDQLGTWHHDLAKRIDAGQDVTVDLRIGRQLLEEAAGRAESDGRRDDARRLRDHEKITDELVELGQRYPDREHESSYEHVLEVVVDPERARFSAWYEMFPRSASPDAGRHGTLRDVIERLSYVAGMGFNVLYLPPIHPIGRQFRKGPNNVTTSRPGDPGVPWAIGGPEGGHKSIHPELGTFDDFAALVDAAHGQGIQIALDIAFQASPDHPWVKEHPSWFRQRPDGTVQYAENPPKKYQDIYPFDFESKDWPGLWRALHDVFSFWIDRGVTIFRVDNPHTKAFPFWEWCISQIKAVHPETIFLSEAFTRPKVMYRLAKVGFSQSYTYFTWRTEKREMTDYLREISRPPVADFFRPNFWPNTPDILHATLQQGGRATFVNRAVMAATMTANWGMYGPAFELGQSTPREPGSEEYLDSEKYQQRTWDLDDPASLAPLITRLNRARLEHSALQSNERVWFHEIDNEQLVAFTKNSADRSDVVLVVASFDAPHRQGGTLRLPPASLEGLGLPADSPFEAHDLLDDSVYRWRGPRVPIELDPVERPAHVFHLRVARP